MGESAWAGTRRQLWRDMDNLCESPAESGLLWAMIIHGDADEQTFGPGCAWEIAPQHTIATPGRTYRVDFALTRGDVRVAVEVDGHAFHHANDDQEAYDACRDYALGLVGWHVIRIEAWKVLANPVDVIDEAILPMLQQFEFHAARPPKKPVESQTDDEFAKTEAELEHRARADDAAGRHEAANGNRRKIESMRMKRERARVVDKLAQCATSPETEDEVLRELFKRRAKMLGMRAG